MDAFFRRREFYSLLAHSFLRILPIILNLYIYNNNMEKLI